MHKRKIDVKTIALQFNDCINNKDIDTLSALMSDDYKLIDRANNCIKGKINNIENWKKFFELFPDYINVFEVVWSKDSIVIMEGHSICSEETLNCKVIWKAIIENDKVKEWRVYDDTEENRLKLGLKNYSM